MGNKSLQKLMDHGHWIIDGKKIFSSETNGPWPFDDERKYSAQKLIDHDHLIIHVRKSPAQKLMDNLNQIV